MARSMGGKEGGLEEGRGECVQSDHAEACLVLSYKVRQD